MKTRNILLLSLAVLSTPASAQRIMKVEKTDGTVIEVSVADVKRVYFEEPEEPDAAVLAGLCPDNHHPHMIDLGIGTLWSCCNVGADSPEQYGDYFAWGETSPKSVYTWQTYSWCNGTNNSLTKYCTNSEYGTIDNLTVLEASDDAATANWGAPWRLPTLIECQTLVRCTSEWTTVNDVYGRKFTGPNGGSIFLPAAGRRLGGGLYYVGSNGLYWSSTLGEGGPYASTLSFHSGGADWNGSGRLYGHTVRPVR